MLAFVNAELEINSSWIVFLRSVFGKAIGFSDKKLLDALTISIAEIKNDELNQNSNQRNGVQTDFNHHLENFIKEKRSAQLDLANSLSLVASSSILTCLRSKELVIISKSLATNLCLNFTLEKPQKIAGLLTLDSELTPNRKKIKLIQEVLNKSSKDYLTTQKQVQNEKNTKIKQWFQTFLHQKNPEKLSLNFNNLLIDASNFHFWSSFEKASPANQSQFCQIIQLHINQPKFLAFNYKPLSLLAKNNRITKINPSQKNIFSLKKRILEDGFISENYLNKGNFAQDLEFLCQKCEELYWATSYQGQNIIS